VEDEDDGDEAGEDKWTVKTDKCRGLSDGEEDVFASVGCFRRHPQFVSGQNIQTKQNIPGVKHQRGETF